MRSWNLDRVLEQLEKEGRTHVWLAKYCGLPVQSLNHYLSGRRYPKRPIIKLLAQALNTTDEYLMGEDKHPQGRVKHKAVTV